MKDYIKIDSFKNLYQAELKKDILKSNDIEAFVVNKRDNMFLLGSIELYTKKEDEKKAKHLLQQFYGLTKINSFVVLKPILLFQKILQNDGIECTIKTKENDKYLLSNYELYVNNEDTEKISSYLSGEKLEGYIKIKTYKKVRQAQLFVAMLEKNQIDTITIKRKDSDYHLQEIAMYVKKENADEAAKMIENPEGYILLRTADNYTKIEVDEETLANKKISALIRPTGEEFDLLVKQEDFEQADDILIRREEWIQLQVFGEMPHAVFYKHLLEQQHIRTVILNEKDRSFLIGNVELYVEQRNFEKAVNILKSV